MSINIETATMWDLTDDRQILAKAMDVSVDIIDDFEPTALSEIGRLMGLKNAAVLLGKKDVAKKASTALELLVDE